MKYFALTLALLVPLACAQDNSPEQTTTTPDNAAAASTQETAPVADSASAQETAPVTESTAALTPEAVLSAEPAIVSAQETAPAPAAQDPAQTDNDPVFQYHLGQEYALRRDYPTARTWFAKAAAQNNADAQTALGILAWQSGDTDRATPPNGSPKPPNKTIPSPMTGRATSPPTTRTPRRRGKNTTVPPSGAAPAPCAISALPG